jgi:hypothetical protein
MLSSVCFEVVPILAQHRGKFAPNVPKVRKSFSTHLMVLLGHEAQVEACFGPFGDSVNLDAR